MECFGSFFSLLFFFPSQHRMVQHSRGLWCYGSIAFYYLFIYLLSSSSHHSPVSALLVPPVSLRVPVQRTAEQDPSLSLPLMWD